MKQSAKQFISLTLLTCLLAFAVEFGLARYSMYTLTVTHIAIEANGHTTYMLDDGMYEGCIDALPGERVLFVHQRGFITGKLWSSEPYSSFKCPDGYNTKLKSL